MALLKGIAANSMGYSFSLAMRTLCPICATSVSYLQKVAQSANRLAVDQCQFAMGLVNTKTNEQAKTKIERRAALIDANSGRVNDFLAGINGIGDDVSKAIDSIADWLKSIRDQGTQSQVLQSTQLGSSTWKLLSGLNTAQKIFIQSLLGTTLRYPYPSRNPKTIVVLPIAASMTIDQLTNLFMYGINSKWPDNGHILVNTCLANNPSSEMLKDKSNVLCNGVVKQTVSNLNDLKLGSTQVGGVSLTSYGFFGLTYSVLFQALTNIKMGKPLGTLARVKMPVEIYGDNHWVNAQFSKSEIEAFISIAPVPLYRAINIAAINPSVGSALVHNISEIIAANYAVSYINQNILNTSLIGTKKSGTVGLVPDDLKRIEKLLNNLKSRLHMKVKAILNNLYIMEAWVNQVNQIQSQIYAKTMFKARGY